MDLIYTAIIAIVSAVASGLYCHRWGRDDGHAAGYEAGHTKGLLEGAGVVSPSAVGGPGAVPR